MSTRRDGTLADAGDADRRTPLASEFDRLANEISARLHTEKLSDSAADPRLYFARAANALLQESGVGNELIDAALHALPPYQREMLRLNIDGLTCAQIAQRQGKTYKAALKDLTSAYARLRLLLVSKDAED